MQSSLSQKLKFLKVETESAVYNDNLVVNLKMTSPQPPAVRPSASIICVLDISGSMDTEATQGGAVQSDGFSRLDLVKHSVNTIINSLSENDALAIVTFSDNARVDLEMVQMTEANKDKATEVIGKMRTQGSTNLWDGIRLGLELTKNDKCKERNTFVVVLSDGEPNQHPPNGELAAATEFIKEHPLNASMSMFGYGYSLDTELLSALTELGGGCFGYIPDCSMIGTIFVNFLSAALSSFSPKLQAKLNMKNAELKSFNGSKLNSANLGAIQYGVTRNCLIEFKGVPKQQDLGQVEIYFEQNSRQKIVVNLTNKVKGSAQEVQVQKMRVNHIKVLQGAIQKSKTDLKQAQKIVIKHLQNMKNLQDSLQEKDKTLEMLIRDIESENPQEGQVMIALTKQEFWSKWGVHYFPALKIAHANEMCTNFKDPGLKIYEGQLFKTLQNVFDTVFIHLTPPIPSIKKFDSQGNPIVVADMNSYYDQQGGCIHGDCQVLTFPAGMKLVKELKKGDCIMGLNGPSFVKCVVETKVNSTVEMVKFQSGLIITKYHPIFTEGKWFFPIDRCPFSDVYVESYYNFVLEEGHSMCVNGINCITLAHGLQDEVAKHAYFGTNIIVQDLSRVQGWDNGHVEVKAFKRDPLLKTVNGIEA